ncbi:MAG: hypothetical protein JO317_09150 [Verrucomicrobiae bacterium]|nr:hypothetical protein [Verrucomicrobiae bacterium]
MKPALPAALFAAALALAGCCATHTCDRDPCSAAVEMPYRRVPHHPPRWVYARNWERIHAGMTMGQVESLLGEAPRVGEYQCHDTENWYYPAPGSGWIQFDRHDRVLRWHEPARLR